MSDNMDEAVLDPALSNGQSLRKRRTLVSNAATDAEIDRLERENRRLSGYAKELREANARLQDELASAQLRASLETYNVGTLVRSYEERFGEFDEKIKAVQKLIASESHEWRNKTQGLVQREEYVDLNRRLSELEVKHDALSSEHYALSGRVPV